MLPRKGSRAITVDGARYRWRLRRRPTARQRHGAPLVVAIARADVRGTLLLVHTGALHPGNDTRRYGASVQPRHVAAWIRQALREGWQPSQPGKPLDLRYPHASPARAGSALTPDDVRALAATRPRDRIARRGWLIDINDRPFLELVRGAEQPHVDRENAERDDGGQIDAGCYFPKVFLHQRAGDSGHGFVLDAADPRRKKSVLMGCSCGIVECWMLMADTWTLDDVVVWANFEQFHRRWIYDLRPLIFDRAAFEALR